MTRCKFNEDYSCGLKYFYGFYGGFRWEMSRAVITRYIIDSIPLKNISFFPNIIQITGTNGKGSTCAYLEKILLSHELNVICLTSPHINSIRERIRLNGNSISKKVFLYLLNIAYPILEAVRSTSYHPLVLQIMTILALMLHEKMGRNFVGIYEVGMGGLNDSTNVFHRNIVGMTKITEDHIPELGKDFMAIVKEKVGLCQPNSIFVCQQQSEEAVDIINQYCLEKSIKKILIENEDDRFVQQPSSSQAMKGPWQQNNFLLALKLAEIVLQKKVEDADKILEKVHVPCRFEKRRVLDKQFILDAAHNVDAVSNLLQFIQNNTEDNHNNCVAIVGFSKSKNWRKMLDMIIRSKIFIKLIVTSATRPRGENPEVLQEYIISKGGNAILFPSMKSTLNWALNSSFSNFFVFGSLLLSADFDRVLHSLGLHKYAVDFNEIDPEQPWMNPLI